MGPDFHDGPLPAACSRLVRYDDVAACKKDLIKTHAQTLREGEMQATFERASSHVTLMTPLAAAKKDGVATAKRQVHKSFLEPEADPLNSIFGAAAGHLFFDGGGDDDDGGGGRVSSSSDRPRPIPPTNVHVSSPECPGSVRFFSEATQLKSTAKP